MVELLNDEVLDMVSGGKSKKKKHKVEWHCQQCNVQFGDPNVSVYKVGSQYVCSREGHILDSGHNYTGRTDISLLN